MIEALEWFTAQQIADLALPGMATTKRGVQAVVTSQGWADVRDEAGLPLSRKRAGRGGGMEYHFSLLPEAARNKLMQARPAKAARPDVATMQLRYERLPQSLKDRALMRLTVLRRVEELQRHGAKKEAAIEVAVAEAIRRGRERGDVVKVSVRSVHDWFDLVSGVEPHHRLIYLAPAYVGRQPKIECHPDLWEAYKAAYLQVNQAPHARCYAEVERIAKASGHAMPSAKYFSRRLAAEVPYDQQVFLREGAKAAKHTFAYADRDRSGLYPLAVTNLDGHLWDILVEWEDGTVGRPYSLAVQDIYSGMVLGVRFDRTLNHHLVRLALGDTIRDYGLPHRILMDNGSENQAKPLAGQIPRLRGKAVEEEPAGLFVQLGIEAVFVTPEHGQAKPVERMFRNWAHNICRSALFNGAYTGHNTLQRPDNRGEKPMPIAQFERLIRTEIDFYCAQKGRKGAGMNGRSFREVWDEGVKLHQPRKLTVEQLRVCMLASEPRPMDRQSGAVSILGHRYWSAELSATKRQKVFVRFDPADLSKTVYVYALDGRFIAEAPRVAQGDFESVEKARAIGRDRRKHTKLLAQAARLQVRLGQDDYAAMLREASDLPVLPANVDMTNVVAPAFGVPRTAEQAGGGSFDENWEAGVSAMLGGGGS